jgi:peptide/nickel transport system ATP-binding protein
MVEQKQLLKVSDLKVQFYTLDGVVKAVENVTFDISVGENFGLVGESGCGKSTTGLAILRLLPSNAVVKDGSIIFNNFDLLKIPEEDMRKIRGKKISIIFQDPSTSLNPLFTVGKQLSDVFKVHFNVKGDKELKNMAIEALKDVALPDPERVYAMFPHELSGGMQQRAVIAIALSTKPKLLIADEPTTMLDVSIQAQILDLILELKRKLNLSILFITHNFGITAEICDRLAVMYAGTIVEEGYVEQIFESPLHPYTRGLLEAVPKIAKEKPYLMHIPGAVPSLINPPTGCRFHPRCPYVSSKCKTKPPIAVEIEHGHKVACYQYAKC